MIDGEKRKTLSGIDWKLDPQERSGYWKHYYPKRVIFMGNTVAVAEKTNLNRIAPEQVRAWTDSRPPERYYLKKEYLCGQLEKISHEHVLWELPMRITDTSLQPVS